MASARSQPWMTDLVEAHDAGDIARHVDAARRGHALPGGRVAPGVGQGPGVTGDPSAPIGHQVGGVAARSAGQRVLHRRGAEGEQRAVDVIEQGGNAAALARGREAGLILRPVQPIPWPSAGRNTGQDNRGGGPFPFATRRPVASTRVSEMVTDDELTALALAADPDAEG